jgi:hypothetical protein
MAHGFLVKTSAFTYPDGYKAPAYERFKHLKSEPDFGDDWGQREAMADQTASIDYGCDFRDGQCKAQRSTKAQQDIESWCCGPMGCCIRCASAVGYLDALPAYALKAVARLWSTKTGFWRKSKGCVLPRKWRSHTCLGFTCSVIPRKPVQDKLVQIGVL